jgi:hypothetical protein
MYNNRQRDVVEPCTATRISMRWMPHSEMTAARKAAVCWNRS